MAEELGKRLTRWQEALAKFSTVSSLHEDQMRLFG